MEKCTAPSARQFQSVLFREITEQCILEAVEASTVESPLPVRTLAAWFELSERAVKAHVERLRRAGHPIGSLRGKPSGYYYARTADELEKSKHALTAELIALARTIRRMVGPQALAEALGQARLEIDNAA